VRAVVANERKTLPKPRSCAAIIAAESAFPNLCSATANTHMREDLANTTTDCQGPDLMNFPVVQQRVRAGCSHRQWLMRRVDGEKRRQLDYRDVAAIIGPAIERGFSRPNNLAAWKEEPGPVPFCEKPLQYTACRSHTGHQKKKLPKQTRPNTARYDAMGQAPPPPNDAPN
jgi:hypothetical protein